MFKAVERKDSRLQSVPENLVQEIENKIKKTTFSKETENLLAQQFGRRIYYE